MLSHQLHHDMDPSSLMVLQPQGCSLVSIMKLETNPRLHDHKVKKNIKLNIESHRSHPYERDVDNEAPRGGRLLNITTLIHVVKINNWGDMDLARTITNPIVEVSRKENGDTKLTSGKNGYEDLDLELRLGLGPA
ncbi:hypothetical protein NC653_017152 [Populus alba x Populus x berolinensis]|uniref:Uncharacterized protein n=1 Tax=Populus alba x Populus x berolinensis TaxID=444605 RepID=A0AAD6W0L9_9ROSI|nr:hypothetical protein NC653_017152 [Populus alba x Populus x berolinensis]